MDIVIVQVHMFLSASEIKTIDQLTVDVLIIFKCLKMCRINYLQYVENITIYTWYVTETLDL